MKNFTITKGQKFTNLDSEVLTIEQITKTVYPTTFINGAFVEINGNKRHLSISAIENFVSN